jgi:antitoxin PrlF
MSLSIEEVSTITAKGQTTIPKSVRQALGVDYGGRIAFRVSDDGVTVVRAEVDDDPAMGAFLSFLARDIKDHPERIKAIAPVLATHIGGLSAGVNSDPDTSIEGEVAL